MQTLYRTLNPTVITETVQSVSEVLARGMLQKIIRKAQFLEALNQAMQPILSDILPSLSQNSCCVMNVTVGKIILQVPNAAIAMRIRMRTQDIVRAIKSISAFSTLTDLHCRVIDNHSQLTGSK